MIAAALIQIHGALSGTQASLRKEAIQRKIEEQMKLGEAGLLEEDHSVMEVNIGDNKTGYFG